MPSRISGAQRVVLSLLAVPGDSGCLAKRVMATRLERHIGSILMALERRGWATAIASTAGRLIWHRTEEGDRVLWEPYKDKGVDGTNPGPALFDEAAE